MGKKNNPTYKTRISDIAALAGVSPMTVSQALNPRAGSVRVSEETRSRIRELARKLNYRPNLAARQLAGGSSRIVGYILDAQSSEEWFSCMATVERILGEAGYRLQIGTQHENFQAIEDQAADFQARNMDGIICGSHTYLGFGAKIPPLFDGFLNKVFIHEPVAPGSVSFVAQDQRTGIRMLTERLLSRGCTAPMLITPGITDHVHYIRINAFLETLRKHHFPHPEQYSFQEVPPESLLTDAGCSWLLDRILPSRPDALIVYSDIIAIRIINLLKKRGLRVPGDIAVASHRHTQFGEANSPSVTGLDYHFSDIGREAANLLLEFMRMPKSAKRPVVGRYILPTIFSGESA